FILALLPANPRLPGAVTAGLANPQAEGDAPRQGRTAPRGPGRGMERAAGEPAAAVALAMAANPLADAEEGLGPAGAEDDEPRRPLSRPERADLVGAVRDSWLAQLRGSWPIAGSHPAESIARRRHQRGSGDHCRHVLVSPLGRSAPASGGSPGGGQQGQSQAT